MAVFRFGTFYTVTVLGPERRGGGMGCSVRARASVLRSRSDRWFRASSISRLSLDS
jgi:hypothetical protein